MHRIAIDGHLLGKGKGGAERQVANLVYWLPRLQPEVEWYVFVNESFEAAESLLNENLKFIRVKHRNLFVQRMFQLPWLVAKHKINLLHVQRIAPIFSPSPVAVTIHDVLPLTNPEDHTTINDRVTRILTYLTSWSAKQIFTVSHVAQTEIIRLFPWCENKVEVISNGIDHFEQEKPIQRIESQNVTSSLPCESYLLYFGAVMERKNLEILLEGYLEFASKQSSPPALVFAGMVRSQELLLKLKRRVEKVKAEHQVFFLGAIEEEDIYTLIKGALAFLAPSRGEGFDLPPVEAMSYGVPVIASDIDVHLEVLKNAALFFKVDSSQSLSELLDDFVSEPKQSEALKEKGFGVAKLYSWKSVAERCAESYLQCINEKSFKSSKRSVMS